MGYNGAQLATLQFLDGNGNPYSQCHLYHYTTGGGTTLKPIWADEAKTTPLAQPFVADPDGRLTFYADGDYRMEVKTSDDVTSFFDQDYWRISKANPLINEEDHGTAVPVTPTANNLNHIFLLHDADGEILDLQACGDTDDPEYTSIINAYIVNNGIADLITKYPIADIRHPDFSGGAVAGSAADQSSQVQAAVDFMDGEGGGVVFIPPGIFKCKNIDVPADITILGTGHSSKLELFDNTSGNYILKSTDELNFEIRSVWLDGGGFGNNTKLVWIFNETGTHMHARMSSCHFENQISPSVALKIEGTSANPLPGIITINGGCHFHETNCGIVVDYVDGFNINDILMRGLTCTPMSISNSTQGVLVGNNLMNWLTTGPAMSFVNSNENVISKNMLNGDEDYSIQTSGTSNFNLIEGNNVRGGHANDIVSGGTNDIVVHNIGSAIFKGGQGETGGVATAADWDFVKYTGSTTSAGTTNGRLIDTTITFPDTALAVDDPPSLWDHVRLPDMTGDENMFFSVTSLLTGVDDNTLQLGHSDEYDSGLTIPVDHLYNAYPNFMDTASDRGWDWEAAFYDANLLGGTNASFTIYGEKGLIRIEVWENGGGVSAVGNVEIQCTSVSKKQIISDQLSNGATKIATTHIFKESGSHTFQWWSNFVSGSGNCDFTLKLYRLKRDVDLTG